MKNKFLILISPLIFILFFEFYFIIDKESEQTQIVDEEEICTENCNVGDKILLSDKSGWHIIGINDDKLILFSDATIDLDGNYLPLNVFSKENTGVPVAFDIQNTRLTENNPYCIFPDIGCSAYEKNGIDVFQDSNIKKIIDSKFLPKIINTLNSDEVVVRLMKKEEFEYFKSLEAANNTCFKWLYYSGYWLMTSYNNYSVFVHKEESETLSHISAYINHGYGIRPVIEVNYDDVL